MFNKCNLKLLCKQWFITLGIKVFFLKNSYIKNKNSFKKNKNSFKKNNNSFKKNNKKKLYYKKNIL